jgi:hypothetical protein
MVESPDHSRSITRLPSTQSEIRASNLIVLAGQLARILPAGATSLWPAMKPRSRDSNELGGSW